MPNNSTNDFETTDHPFRDDAIRRLLEIYVENDDLESFYALYEGEIVSGRVKTGSDYIHRRACIFWSPRLPTCQDRTRRYRAG